MSNGCTALMIAGQVSDRRSVLFVESEGTRYINVVAAFERLPSMIERTFLRRFDNWIDGISNPVHYHGWGKSQYGGRYQNCFVSKAREHRLYGFLCHPKMRDASYESCVLAIHAFKQEWTTDETELNRAKVISESQTVTAAVISLLAA